MRIPTFALRGRACLPALVLAWPLAALPASGQVLRLPQAYVVRDVRLAVAEDAPRMHLVLRDGRIERVLEDGAQLPAAARVVEGRGMLALPAFIDALSQNGVTTPEPAAARDLAPDESADILADMRLANRKGLQPAFEAARAVAFEDGKVKVWRQAGFGALLVAPEGQLLAGSSALLSTRLAAPREAILDAEVFQHGVFQASGRGYPSSAMGYVAHLRQFLMDAEHGRELEQREAAGRPGPRPPHDPDLLAARRLLDGHQRLVVHANSRGEIERWIALADEFGLKLAISGGLQAWRIAPTLAARRIPVILTLDWGEEPKDPHAKATPDKGRRAEGKETEGEGKPAGDKPEGETPEGKAQGEKSSAEGDKPAEPKPFMFEEPLALKEERRRLWLEGRDCALRLNEAGVEFVFGSRASNAEELLKKVRQLVEAGLPAEVALDALTARAARVLGQERRLGAIAAGQDASFALWTHPPMDKEAKVAWLFVDGFAHDFEVKPEEPKKPAAPGEARADASGIWELAFDGDMGAGNAVAELEMAPDGTVQGVVRSPRPDGGAGELSVPYTGKVEGKRLVLKGKLPMGAVDADVTIEVVLEGESLSGEAHVEAPDGTLRSTLSGKRRPKTPKGTR